MGRFARCLGPLLAALVTLRLLAAGPAQAAPPLTKTSLTPAQRGELAEAERLAREAERLGEAGKYAEALPLAERALGLRERALGGEHLEVAASLQQVGKLYHSMGRLPRAESCHRRALALYEKALGPERPDVATSLNNLAGLYQTGGAYAQAEPLFVRALALHEKALGKNHPAVANSLNNLAAVYQAQGAYAKAEPLFRRAISIFESALGPDHPTVAVALNNLANLYRAQGAYAQAEPLFVRALATREKVLGKNHPAVATSLNNLAVLDQAQGAYEKAEPKVLRALSIFERALGPDHPAVATTLNNLAALYLAQSARHSPTVVYGHSCSEPTYQKSRLGAPSLSSTGWAYPTMSVFNGTELAPEQPSCDKYEIDRKNDFVALSEQVRWRALVSFQKAFGPDHPAVATSYHALALLYAAKEKGRPAGALDLAARAAAARERHLASQLSGLPASRKGQLLQTFRGENDAIASLHAQRAPGDETALRLALATALRRKGRVLDELADARASLRRHLTPELRAEFDALAAKQAELSSLRRGTRPEQAEAVRALREELDERESELARKSVDFRTRTAPVTIRRVQAALPSDAALVEFLRYRRFDFDGGPQPWREERYVAYLLRREGPPRFVDLGEARPIDEWIRAARAGLTSRDTRGDVRGPLRALSALVLSPVREALGPAPHLLISPDGALNLLPFEALVDERGRYLLETTLVTYLSSGRDLLRLRERPVPRSGPLVVAGPDYGPGEPFVPLPGASAEALEVRRQFPRAAVLQGTAATKEALAQAHGPLLLHVATHGFFRGPTARPPTSVAHLRGTTIESSTPAPAPAEDPAETLDAAGLAFAGANQRPDAILSARELASLDLWGTKLVVLSACESGVGQVASGEGVYGLRRALVIAGAASQVTSLWNVSDEATRRLMAHYYAGLAEGRGRSEALRRARLSMLAEPATAHPYYWAAFVPAGDWRPLEDGATVPRVAPGGTCGCRTAGGGATGGEPGLALAALAAGATYARRKRPRDPQQPFALRRSSSNARRADEPLASAPLPQRAALSHRGAP
ncbi:MAG TPA: CHAT domain-containing tetratricopeptide repeat protein [Polyangiaceae bacterium]|nr:CHAT domain-containing tetratricopeptide repeat protein [Polyangiaceae bacterium]